ncbi:MAG: hypothetical protein ACPGOV_11085 [Magnetovibrionaceae bacterium]
MARPQIRISSLLVAGIGLAYPFAVYFGLTYLSPLVIGGLLVGFLLLRLILKWEREAPRLDLAVLLLTLVVVVVTMFFDQALAIKIYPVAISLGLACVFGYSVLSPPTVIERFARMVEPDLNGRGVIYTRNVTLVWIAFFLVNACLSAASAVIGDLETWVLYNGFISYVLIGSLFAGEFIVRQFVKKHHRESLPE